MQPEKALGFMAFLLGCLTVKAACIAMSVWLDVSAPAFTDRALTAYQSRGKRSFILGAINGLILLFLFIVLVNTQIKPLALLGILILFILIALVLTGYAVAYHDFGSRLRGDRDWSAMRATILGGTVAELMFLTPVVGQIFSLGVLFRGLGAVVTALLSRGAVRNDSNPESA
ncbi:MAG: hypothetical protein IT367_17320 [Candidatus Hydrogenedentes bacterium]|nr:hypothetical protein [Candidatus Hydrogenedentota bacterium]